jgi:hypothetical protein
MPGGPLDETLRVAERRDIARARRHPGSVPGRDTSPPRRCAFCLGPLENGAPVCSDACDDGLWDLIPTQDGTIWIPRRNVL